ncbi:MAG: ubiquitin family protein [Gammaproteobacteria bacterium]
MTIKIHYGVNYHREDNFKTIAIKQTTTLKEIKQLIREKQGISNEHTLIIKLDNSLLGNDEKNFP